MKINTRIAAVAVLLPALAGCYRSRVAQVELVNESGQRVENVEVSYPEASFGKTLLAPGATFQYRIKTTDTGPLKISFTNASGEAKNYTLLSLRKNEEGAITIRITQDSANAIRH